MQADYEGVSAVVAIEAHDEPASKLIVETGTPHPQNAFTESSIGVVPSQVRKWIELGLELGWDPFGGGVWIATVDPEGAMRISPR